MTFPLMVIPGKVLTSTRRLTIELPALSSIWIWMMGSVSIGVVLDSRMVTQRSCDDRMPFKRINLLPTLCYYIYNLKLYGSIPTICKYTARNQFILNVTTQRAFCKFFRMRSSIVDCIRCPTLFTFRVLEQYDLLLKFQ